MLRSLIILSSLLVGLSGCAKKSDDNAGNTTGSSSFPSQVSVDTQ